MKKAAGVYVIEITRGTKPPVFYIGQSIHMAERRMCHLRALRAKRHDNLYMQNAFHKYGEAAFRFRQILRCANENLCMYEQAVLDWYRASHGIRVLNVMTECVRSPIGVKRRPETVLKMSVLQKGRKKSPEHVEKNRQSHLGFKHSEATKVKLSEYHKGRASHPNSLAAFEAARATTRVDRLREALCGKPKIHSEETKQKIATTLRGRTSCPIANEKRRQAMIGRKMAPEAVAKRVASRLANAAKKQAETIWSQSEAAQL